MMSLTEYLEWREKKAEKALLIMGADRQVFTSAFVPMWMRDYWLHYYPEEQVKAGKWTSLEAFDKALSDWWDLLPEDVKRILSGNMPLRANAEATIAMLTCLSLK